MMNVAPGVDLAGLLHRGSLAGTTVWATWGRRRVFQPWIFE
jgi:hypothetical protein